MINPMETKRMNILALSYLFPNRAQPEYGVFVFNRLMALREHCNLKVIAPVQWYPLIRRLLPARRGGAVPPRDELGGIEVRHPRFPVIPRYLKWLDAVSYLLAVRPVAADLRRGASFEFDLIDVHWTYPDILAGYVLARSSGRKFIVTVRGREALYLGENSIRRRIVARLLRKADFVVALSAELRALVLGLGVAPERCRVVLNGVDLSRFHPEERECSRRRLGLPPGRRIIVSVGSLIERKGHHELVRIMPGLSASGDVDLFIVGGANPEGDYSSVLRAMIAGLGLANVHLVDKVEHEALPDWYNAADLFCLATRGEGCPNVVLEALACGTPVVVTDVGAVGELVVEGENGFLLRPDELCSLEATVRAALDRNWDRERIAAGMNGWGWSSCAAQVIDIYRTVLEERPGQGERHEDTVPSQNAG